MEPIHRSFSLFLKGAIPGRGIIYPFHNLEEPIHKRVRQRLEGGYKKLYKNRELYGKV